MRTFFATHIKLIIFLLLVVFVIGIYPLASRAILIFSQSVRTNPNLENGLIAYWSFDGGHATSSNATLVTVASSSVSSGAGNNNGFETTLGTGRLDAAVNDAGYMRDNNSGTGVATDGCGTIPQSEDDQHIFSNFGITLSSVGDVKGIQVVTVGKVDSTVGTNFFCIALSWDGGTSWTAGVASADLVTTDQADFYGSSFDTWGRSWSASELSNANFRIMVMPDSSSSNTRDYSLNYLAVVVYSDGYKDQTGKGYTAIPQSNVLDAVGKIGSAAYFDGVDTGLDISSASGAVNTSKGTVALWMKRDFADTIATDKNVFTIYTDLTNYLTMNYDNTNDRWSYAHVRGGSLDEATTPASVIGTSTWSHVVATWDTTADVIKLYVDGVEKSSSSGLGTWSGTPTIGFVSDTAITFLGSIDDFRIYTRALSVDEIKRLYQIGATSKINTSLIGADPVLDRGLTGYWTFDGPDIDLSNNTGELKDRATNVWLDWVNHATTTVPGKIGQAISFDGVNDYVDADRYTDAAIGSTSTVSVWIYPRDNGNTAAVYALNNIAGSSGQWCGLTIGTTGGITAVWGYAYAGGQASSTFTVNEWQQITWVHSPTYHKMYRNGVLVDTESGGGCQGGSYDFQIGGIGASQNFNGSLDDLRTYNRLLSDVEIKRLYDIGATAKVNTSMTGANNVLENGLVSHYTFDGPDVFTASTTGEIVNKKSAIRADWINHASTTVLGKIGQAIDFDGTDDYTLERNPSFEGAPIMTIAAWIRTTTIGINTIFGVSDDGSNNEAFSFGVDGSGKMYARVKTTVDIKNCNSNTAGADGQVISGDWVFVVVTNTQSAGTDFYKNGVLQSDDCGSDIDWIDDLSSAVDVATVGGWAVGSPAQHFDGIIDDVRIYNRALTATEIKRLYDIGR